MDKNIKTKIIQYAFFTAAATSVYFLEGMAVRVLPVPFLRIGLANVIILILLMKREFMMAFVVNITKTLIGGLLCFTLMSPTTLLSICGGLGAMLVMWLLLFSKINFSVLGISIAGAVMHNIIQVLLVRLIIIPRDSIMYLLPVMMLVGLVTGLVTGIIAFEVIQKLQDKEKCQTVTA